MPKYKCLARRAAALLTGVVVLGWTVAVLALWALVVWNVIR